MGTTYRRQGKTRQLGNTGISYRTNYSTSGVSESISYGPVTLNTRGRVTVNWGKVLPFLKGFRSTL